MKNISLLLVSACLLSLGACKKKEEPTVRKPTVMHGKYLAKVNSWQSNNNNEVTLNTFEINDAGDLTSVKTYGTNAQPLLHLNSFMKDGNGRVTKISGTYKNAEPVSYVFEYNNDGNVARQTYALGDSPASTTQYTYDGSRRITRVEVMKNGAVTESRSYSYGSAGNNPTGVEIVAEGTGGAKGLRYMYDERKNPYLTLPRVLYYIGLGEFYDNNIVTATDVSGTAQTMTYEYNADNYPVKRNDGAGMGMKYYYK